MKRAATLAVALFQLCSMGCDRPTGSLIEGIPDSEIAVTPARETISGVVVALQMDQLRARRTIEALFSREIVSPYGGYRFSEKRAGQSRTLFSTWISVEETDGDAWLQIYQVVKHRVEGREFHTKIWMPFKVEDRTRVVLWSETEEILSTLARHSVSFGVRCTIGGADLARDGKRARDDVRAGRSLSMSQAGCRRRSDPLARGGDSDLEGAAR